MSNEETELLSQVQVLEDLIVNVVHYFEDPYDYPLFTQGLQQLRLV